jgi:hypothetical protein
MGEGMSSRLLKEFNKVEIPCALFTVFSTGGVDFVGGFALYNFIKRSLFSPTGQLALGKMDFE